MLKTFYQNLRPFRSTYHWHSDLLKSFLFFFYEKYTFISLFLWWLFQFSQFSFCFWISSMIFGHKVSWWLISSFFRKKKVVCCWISQLFVLRQRKDPAWEPTRFQFYLINQMGKKLGGKTLHHLQPYVKGWPHSLCWQETSASQSCVMPPKLLSVHTTGVTPPYKGWTLELYATRF